MFPDRLSRRDVLRIGSLSIFGGLVPRLARAAGATATEARRRSCIFILLQGGASHIDLWDPKPGAPSEVRGPYRPIETAAPGIRFGELMVESARVADRLCVVRSMTHRFTNHIAGTYITLTGSNDQPDRDREAHGDDFPGPGAVLHHLERSVSSVPRSISLPNWLSIPGPSNRMPGQYGGFLGSTRDPFLLDGDPSKAGYDPLALDLGDGMTLPRLRGRLGLLERLDRAARTLEPELNERYDQLRDSASGLIVDGRLREALRIEKESDATRDRYGRTKIGQSLLLARRLVEAGVQFVAYNSFNQTWDTHGGLVPRYQQIVPPMDKAFGALVADLGERGMLDDTLVINTGEFGRTPVINNGAGRDHWPNAYTTVLAGGGVRGGVVHGASDSKGAEVIDGAVAPADILATMWSRLGVDPRATIHDRLDRPHLVSSGRVLGELIA